MRRRIFFYSSKKTYRMAQDLNPTDALDCFVSMITNYEHRIAHASRAVARHIPALLNDIPQAPVILDNACGTGAASEELLRAFPLARIYAVDILPSMVQAMKALAAVTPQLKNGIVEIEEMNGQTLRYESDFIDVSLTNFGIFYFQDPALGAKEIFRTLKPGGYAILTVLEDLGFKPVLWEVQRRISPMSPLTGLSLLDPWCDGTLLGNTLRQAGFTSVEMRSVV